MKEAAINSQDVYDQSTKHLRSITQQIASFKGYRFKSCLMKKSCDLFVDHTLHNKQYQLEKIAIATQQLQIIDILSLFKVLRLYNPFRDSQCVSKCKNVFEINY